MGSMLICMRTTLNLDDALAAAAKAEAARSGSTMTSLIEEGLKKVLEERSTDVGSRTALILHLGREIAGGIPEPWRSSEHGDLLYDDRGLPG